MANGTDLAEKWARAPIGGTDVARDPVAEARQ